MMSLPGVSVLLPTYNRADYLRATIQSALDQTHPPYEVVVVDDGSTDSTAEVVRRLAEPRVRYVFQQNRGVSAALNTAFRASTGRYIALLGSDDLWLPSLLAEEVPIMDENPAVGLVYARAQGMDPQDRPMAQILGAPDKFPGSTFKSLLYGDDVCGLTAVFRREVVEQAGLWDESFVANEDWDIWLRMSLVTRFYFLDKVLARFRIHPGSLTGGKSDRFVQVLRDRERLLDKVFSLPNLPPEASEVKALAYRNNYMDIGLRWLSVGNWRECLRYFGQAVRVSPNPVLTPVRILYLIVFYRYLSKRAWGTRLVNSLAERRRGHAS